MRDEKREPVLKFHADTSADCIRFELTVLYVNEDGELRNYTDSFGGSETANADLRITAQANRTDTDAPYGWHVEYRDIFSVRLERAETMVKTLRKIDRGLARLDAELGHPESFAAYAARVAKVLGIKRFCRQRGEARGGFYANNDYQFGDVSYVAFWVTQALAEYRKPTGVAH